MSVRKARGFTLFEMMITVAIAGLVAAFAIPAFQDVMTRTRINSTTEELVNSLALARNTAISRRRRVVLVPDPIETPSWTLRLDSGAGEVLSRHRIEGTIRLTSAVAVEEITFLPSGNVQKTLPGPPAPLDFTFTVCDSSTNKELGRSVTLSRVGRIRAFPNAATSTCNP